MQTTFTEADFDKLSWHDCHLWNIGFQCGRPEKDDWTSELVLDIDYIVEWICGQDRVCQFQVAPATLVFHGVTDPSINITWGTSGFQNSLHPVSIGHISREVVQNQKVYLDRSYYCWRVILNWPDASEMAFGAVGFTQILRAEPIMTPHQQLTMKQRQEIEQPSRLI